MCEPISCCILIGCWYMYKKDKEKKAAAGPRPVSVAPNGGAKTAATPVGMRQTGGTWRGVGGQRQRQTVDKNGTTIWVTVDEAGDSGGDAGGDSGYVAGDSGGYTAGDSGGYSGGDSGGNSGGGGGDY